MDNNQERMLCFMRQAIELAKESAARDEVPVGALIVKDGIIIASAGNSREASHDATAHAELTAIRSACRALGGWRLIGCELYVTLEPCAMCAGAIINSRLDCVVYGAYDKRFGALGSIVDLSAYPFNHKPKVISGVLSEECSAVLSDYFRKKRV